MSDQPLVSMIVYGYKHQKFIREAVQGALGQTYGNLEIILTDDASPDGTFDIMAEEAKGYRGPHRVILNRNAENLGVAKHINKAVQLASGDLLVFQDGDDVSFPTRASRLVERWTLDQPRAGLVFSDAIRVAADGSVLPQQIPPLPMATLEEVSAGKFFVVGGCVSAYSRSLFETFGPLTSSVEYADYVLTFRALLSGGCAFVNEPLVYYRVHSESLTRSVEKSERAQAARWTKHAVGEAETRLRDWDHSGKANLRLRRRLVRDLDYARLDQRSSTGSRFAAFCCFFRAIGLGMPRAALLFLRRDILMNRKSQ